jgi:23S rRNA (uracil1939-C5)-methyltransferase
MKLRIEKAIYGGAGLARVAPDSSTSKGGEASAAGKTVFVSNALPGEVVEAHITEDRRSYSTAEVDQVLEPSAERVEPACEYFPVCGGCQYQHAHAQYQMAMKLGILKDTFQRAQLGQHLPPDIEGVSGPPWGYRNRVRLQVAQKSGKLALCYRERRSHKTLPVTHCPIAAPLIERAITSVLQLGQENGLATLCDEIEFFVNGEEDALLISLRTNRPTRKNSRSTEEALQRFAASLKLILPELTGAGLFSGEDHAERLLSQWGQRSLTYTVSGHKYQVSLGSFFQVNRFLLPQLKELVAGKRSGRTAWDLYAGVGFFACVLGFEHVTAVEASPFSSFDLKQNLAGTSHRAVRSSTLEFLRDQGRPERRHERRQEAGPDLILLDPPRAGLGKEICKELERIAAPEIVYVSCDPATLARDLQALLQSGYRLDKLHMVDMFPQTFHLESVAVLARN